MKLYPLIALLMILFSAQSDAQTDAVFKVSKPKAQITIMPDVDALQAGVTYSFTISGISPAQVKKVEANFGNITYKTSANGKNIELKISVIGSLTRTGTLTVSGGGGTVLFRRGYRIIAKVRYTDYYPSASGASPTYPVILLLNKDTLASYGTVSLKQIQTAGYLTLVDAKLTTNVIRKNLMCKIRIVHDTTTTVLHSSYDRLSDKVKLGFSKAVAGDKIIIESMENLWIDATRGDHIAPYGDLSYELTVAD